MQDIVKEIIRLHIPSALLHGNIAKAASVNAWAIAKISN
jgi:hypothetical protein